MSETTTKIVKELDGKSGDGWTLSKFEDSGGKKYQTFDDGIAAQVRGLIGREVVLQFEVETSNRNGRTYTNNMITAAFPVGGGAAVSGGVVSAGFSLSPVDQRLKAMDQALVAAKQLDEFPDFETLVGMADAFLGYALDEIEVDGDPTPPTPSETVPN